MRISFVCATLCSVRCSEPEVQCTTFVCVGKCASVRPINSCLLATHADYVP